FLHFPYHSHKNNCPVTGDCIKYKQKAHVTVSQSLETMEYLWLVLCFCIYRGARTNVAAAHEIPLEAKMLSGEALVEYLKKNQDLFEVNSDPTPGFESKLMDIKFKNDDAYTVVKDDPDPGDDIPENYDPRKIWTNCTSLFTIRDQANCGSCWAVSTAAAISDRICIATKGEKQVYISATDIMTCCTRPCGHGCGGGWSFNAWKFFVDDGVVSGGQYLSKGCCRPYPLHPCGRHGNDTYYGECPPGLAYTPDCKRKCQPAFKKVYRMDKRYGKIAYKLPNSVKAIQRDILKYGSVTGSFEVFEDFKHYKSGIYKYTAGRSRGYHAVKIIGWGKENGTDYWLIANSWHNDWGENGFFRILRGTNHCGIEEKVSGGLVDVNSL
uniref:Pept_C1 domain-containing protein n=1 Tax=Haemonchus contortus TaxID=6289 RepID=A0A7I4XTT8_HAECO